MSAEGEKGGSVLSQYRASGEILKWPKVYGLIL